MNQPKTSLAARGRLARCAVLALLCFAGCQEDVGTSVRVSLVYKDTWRMASADVIIAQEELKLESNAPISHEILLLLPDSLAGTVMPFEMWGVRDGERISHGSALALVRKGETVDATLVLDRLPCGVFCEPGEVQCEGSGVATCQENEDGCLEWSPPQMCPEATPYCSGGVCGDDCVNECEAGEGTCVDANTQRSCGEHDNDLCRDYGPNVVCDAGQVCYSGRCAPVCSFGALSSAPVAGSNAGFTPAVAVDRAGNVYAVYSAGGNRRILYATRTKSGAWPATWSDTGIVGEDPSIAVDKTGGVHVLAGGATATYGFLPAGAMQWQLTSLETGADIATASSLAIADDGGVHAAYYRSSDKTLRYGKKGTPWAIESVRADLGQRVDLTLIGATPHLVSFDDDSSLWYSTFANGTWTSTMIRDLATNNLATVAATSIVAGRNGTLHVVHSDLYPTLDDLRYLYRPPGGSWTTRAIVIDDTGSTVGAYPDLAIDPFDRLHVTYRTTGTVAALRYATKEAGIDDWSIAVQPAFTSGIAPSIAIDSLANVHILSAVLGGSVVETQRTCSN